MAQGPGVYDDLCTLVRERAEAVGAIILVFGGNKGSGMSMQAPDILTAEVADILEELVVQIRGDTEQKELREKVITAFIAEEDADEIIQQIEKVLEEHSADGQPQS